jgi:predicted membrane GTPase involved in stress response
MIAFLQINPVRAKELTNVRAAGKDENVKLSPPRLVCICLSSCSYFYVSISSGGLYASI